MIIRENYLRKIRPFYEQDLIKVITGIRRCGKSVLLNQIISEIKNNNIDDEHIIYLNFELQDYEDIKNANSLNNYIKDKIKDKNKYYLFFDEIQNVEEWEKVINSFKASLNVSIFITGSNSNLLSGELATHLAGRYVSFRIQPFSFKEVCELKNAEKENLEDIFNDYLSWGGLPQRFTVGEEEQIIAYLENIYDSIVLKDIILRNKIQNVNMLELLIQYLVSTPSQTFSGTSIAKHFESDKRTISPEAIYNYFNYISNSFIINKVQRFDIKGKKILSKLDKYYLTDLGLAHVKNINKKIDLGASLENIVFNELINRGYTVYTGKNGDKEIDFIATKTDEKLYFQVAYILADDRVAEREFGAYKGIDDNYPKYVLTLDKFNFSQNGIIHKNVIEWLLDK